MPDAHDPPNQKREERLMPPNRKKVHEPLRSWQLPVGFCWSNPAPELLLPSLTQFPFSSCCVYLAWVDVPHRSDQEPQALPESCTSCSNRVLVVRDQKNASWANCHPSRRQNGYRPLGSFFTKVGSFLLSKVIVSLECFLTSKTQNPPRLLHSA